MEFWEMCFDNGWCDSDYLRQAVTTEENPYGDITEKQFKDMTGEDFIKVSAS